MNEQIFDTTGWCDQSPSLHLKGEILRKIPGRERSRRIRVLVVGLASSGIGVAALSSVLLLSSAPLTLAQVIAADEKAESITIVNRRIMGDPKKPTFTSTTKEVGDVALIFNMSDSRPTALTLTYIDNDGTLTYDSRFNLAILDSDQKHRSFAFHRPKASEILKDFKAAKVEKAFDWNGRKVTRFTCKVVLNNTDVDQELLVDPETNLPIKFIVLRDHRSWGDEYTCDYTKLDPKSLKPKIPEGTLIVDHEKLRNQMAQIVSLTKAPIPVIESSPYELAVLVNRSVIPTLNSSEFALTTVNSNGIKETSKGRLSRFSSYNVRVSGKDFSVLAVQQLDSHWKTNWLGDKASGSLTINGKTIKFSRLPVIKSGFSSLLLRPFAETYKLTHPEVQPRKPWTPPKKTS